MIISATRSEESFLLSCWTSVTIITVHLATAIGGTCGVGCGEYFVVGLYWLSRRISQTTPSALSVKHAADPRIDHQVRPHIPSWKRGTGQCTRYGPMRTLRERGAHLDIDTYLHFVVRHVCLRRPSSNESYHLYVRTDVNYDSICLSRLLAPSVPSPLASCLYYTSLSLWDISSQDCSQADCKFVWY